MSMDEVRYEVDPELQPHLGTMTAYEMWLAQQAGLIRPVPAPDDDSA